MEGVFPKSDARNPFVELDEAVAGLNGAVERFAQRRTCEKVTDIALGLIAVVAGLALSTTGVVLLKTIFPLGIFMAAAVPITAAVKAQIGTYAAMIIGGLGLQLMGAASVYHGTSR